MKPELAIASEAVAPAPRSGHPLRLRELAFAAIANLVPGTTSDSAAVPEFQFLRQQQELLGTVGEDWENWGQALTATLNAPASEDVRLLHLANELRLTLIETLAVALAAAVEDEPLAGRVLIRVQSPVGGSRPTLGLLTTAFASAVPPGESPWALLIDGMAARSGLLSFVNESAPLPERAVAVPSPLCLALQGHDSAWPGVEIGNGLTGPEIVLSATAMAEAECHATALFCGAETKLLIRSGSAHEGRAAAAAIAGGLGRRAAFFETDKLMGVGPWLALLDLLPVFPCELGPSERRRLPELIGYDGPVLAIAGPEGSVETRQGPPPSWTLAIPPAGEREVLWRSVLGMASGTLPTELARHHRHGAGRIAQVGLLARHQAALRAARRGKSSTSPDVDGAPSHEDVAAASWHSEGGLESLAEPMREQVPNGALVVSPALRGQLDLLALRCRAREGLAEGLGPSAVARYRTGVRALFTGPSGTGKTLAAGWLATRMALPLYRVDLASVTSKYIGETEKNLAQLLARAEQAEVILLFDEADSLFGKRTDIRDSNDRFANAQTNYLLQRIETYDGIVLLTSNSRSRFDAAFSRRLDFVLEFQLPTPDERRALWQAHLGEHHCLSAGELNRLAVLADLAGGHIRNAVLTAALLAREAGEKISLAHCVRGLESEFQKLNRPPPGELLTPA